MYFKSKFILGVSILGLLIWSGCSKKDTTKEAVNTEKQSKRVETPKKEVDRVQPVYANIVMKIGKVQAYKSKSGKIESAFVGMKLEEADRLIVSKNAQAVIKTDTGSIIKLKENTEFSLNTLRKVDGKEQNSFAMKIGKAILKPRKLKKGEKFEVGEKVYIGDGKRDKVQYILGRCPREKLTETARDQLRDYIEEIVLKDEQRFVNFFNKAQAINTRLHQFELLPGLGKKHTSAILTAREEKEFESFDDIRERVANMPAPDKVIGKRIMEELTEIQRHNLFIF